MKRCFILCLAVLALGSCVPTFKEGLPVPKHPKVDKELLGTWYAKAESGKISKCNISAKKNGWIEIRYTDNILDEANEPNYVTMPTYTSEIKGEKFLSVPMYALAPDGKPTDCNGYKIVNYKIQQSNLHIRLFSLDKVQHLIETGVLKGKVEKEFLFNHVMVTSSGKDVVDLIKSRGVESVVEPNVVLTLTRTRPDANQPPKSTDKDASLVS